MRGRIDISMSWTVPTQQQCMRCPPVQAVLPTQEGTRIGCPSSCACGYRCGTLAAAVIVPSDVAAAPTTATISRPAPVPSLGSATADHVEHAAELIRQARNPVLFVGVRAGDPASCAALRALLAVTDLPVVETFQAAGVVSRALEDRYVGRVGLFRNQPGDILVADADVIVTVGYDAVEYDPRLWNTAPGRTLIHLDELPADIDVHYQPTLELPGDIAATLTDLAPRLAGWRLPDAAAATVAEQRSALAAIDEQARNQPETKLGLNPAALCLKIRELVDDDATIACDVGSNYIFMGRHFRAYQPRRLCSPTDSRLLVLRCHGARPPRWCAPAPRWCRYPATADSFSAHRNWRPPLGSG